MDFTLLQKLSDAFGPPGFEDDIAALVKQELAGYPLREDRSHNLVLAKTSGPDRPNVIIDAHMDECGFIVNHVGKNGYVQFMPLGGLYARNMPGHAVVFKTRGNAFCRGIVSTLPVHIKKYLPGQKDITFKDLYVDMGTISSQETEAELGVSMGDPGVFAVTCRETRHALMGKAFDDRVGVFMLLQLLNQVYTRDYPYNLYFSFSSQEEYGIIGATKTANRIKPDVFVALEGTTGSDLPNLPEYLVPCYPGQGPCVTLADHTMILSPKVRDMLDGMQTQAQWHYKRPVFGGTNAAVMNRQGIDGLGMVVSAPCRSIHSACSTVRKSDLEQMLIFLTDLLDNLNALL